MTDLTLFTNRNTRRDFVVNAIDSLSAKPCNVYIAVAFSTENAILPKGLDRMAGRSDVSGGWGRIDND